MWLHYTTALTCTKPACFFIYREETLVIGHLALTLWNLIPREAWTATHQNISHLTRKQRRELIATLNSCVQVIRHDADAGAHCDATGPGGVQVIGEGGRGDGHALRHPVRGENSRVEGFF